MPDKIIQQFGLNPADHQIEAFGSGLINHTYKVTGSRQAYILQQINTGVFNFPWQIAQNIGLLQDYLSETAPGYLFVAPLPTLSGRYLYEDTTGVYYRLFPFVEGSHTLTTVSTEKEAFEAARQFGKFTRLLNNFDIQKLEYPLPDFHNLKLRFDQFKAAQQNANKDRLEASFSEIRNVYEHYHILQQYNELVADEDFPLRVVHHDTKISNVLFDRDQNGLCVIDLDTVMPGYYLSDVGDMMRTYLSPANEEEKDLSKIHIRESFFVAIYKGYISEMGPILTEKEKQFFIFSGEMMIYMQALRFLTDFLNNDMYYGAKYPQHNLVRSRNQFQLLLRYIASKERFHRLINEAM